MSFSHSHKINLYDKYNVKYESTIMNTSANNAKTTSANGKRSRVEFDFFFKFYSWLPWESQEGRPVKRAKIVAPVTPDITTNLYDNNSNDKKNKP